MEKDSGRVESYELKVKVITAAASSSDDETLVE